MGATAARVLPERRSLLSDQEDADGVTAVVARAPRPAVEALLGELLPLLEHELSAKTAVATAITPGDPKRTLTRGLLANVMITAS